MTKIIMCLAASVAFTCSQTTIVHSMSFDLVCSVQGYSTRSDGSEFKQPILSERKISIYINEKDPTESSVELTSANLLGIYHNRKDDTRLKDHPYSTSLIINQDQIVGTSMIEYPSVLSKQITYFLYDMKTGKVSYSFRNLKNNGPSDGHRFDGVCKRV